MMRNFFKKYFWFHDNKFVKVKYIDSLRKIDYDEIYFQVAEDDRLHLGDRYFLSVICERLNRNKRPGSTIFYLTTIRRLDIKIPGTYLGLDWSKPLMLSIEEHIRWKLKELGVSSIEIFQKEKGQEKKILLSTEIASNRLRIVGLKSKFVKILNLFQQEGFEIYHLGQKYPQWLIHHGILIKENFKGLGLGKKLIQDKTYWALITYDNFWMHVAVHNDKKCYILQRRKFTIVNLVNHIASLNTSTKTSNTIYIT